MLHPFLCSQNVWNTVADQLADTGRFEVFAPTMVGHNGGPRARLVPGHRGARRRRRAADGRAGLETAHIVGNSLGGWVAFELERRGRARTLTAIAPAGGWPRYTPAKYETVLKFLLGFPVWLIAARLLGPRILELPFARTLATLPVSGPADGPSHADLLDLVDDATHCTAYVQLLVKSRCCPGCWNSRASRRPTQLVLCEKDRVFPHPRGTRTSSRTCPRGHEITRLDGVGHIPMLEAPGRITELIADFVDAHAEPEAAPRG